MTISEKQETLLEFIKKFQEEKQRNPRLTELTSEFKVSNSAIIQQLKSLEESGYIDMPDGVLSISTRPRYDIFLSYSNDDREIANTIYSRLEQEGFRVWKDNFKLRTGDYFTTEIFKAIRSSKLFLLLISDSAIQSRFVHEEISHAKHHNIIKGNPKIFPIVVQPYTLELPPEVSNIHWKKVLDISNESQMIQLLDEIQIQLFSKPVLSPKKSYNSNFAQFIRDSSNDLDREVTNKNDYDYFQFALQPIEDPEIKQLMDLENILRETTVDIKRWGGFNIPPFYETSENLKSILTQSGIQFVKEFSGKDAWFRSWELYAYYFKKNGNFLYRNSLRESFANDQELRGTFSIDWLVLDVTRSLIFARNLINKTKCKKWQYTLKYHGLKDKTLVILNQRRFSLFRTYKKEGENEYIISVDIDDKTIVEDVVYNICYEIIYLFGWKNMNENVLKSDISSLLNGIFPE